MLVPAIIRRFTSVANKKELADIRDNPGRILMVKQAERLGNIILLNSAISAIKNNFPACKIDLLLPAKFASVMENDERINGIIRVFPKKYISRPWSLWRLIRDIRKRSYDLTIDCSDFNSPSSTGIAYSLLSGARAKAGWMIGARKFFDIEIERYSGPAHASEMYLKLISGIFRKELSGSPYFDHGSYGKPGNSTVIGINCGGRGKKRWPLENAIKLGSLLSEKGISIEYILGPDEEELREKFENDIKLKNQLLPLMSIKELKATICKYWVFISSDTGPMHLAWALKIPVVAIFLMSEIEKFRPLSPGSAAIDGAGEVSPQEVFDKTMEILNNKGIPV